MPWAARTTGSAIRASATFEAPCLPGERPAVHESRTTPVSTDAGFLYFRNFLGEYVAQLRREPLGAEIVEALPRRSACGSSRRSASRSARTRRRSAQWLKQASPATRCLAFEANPYVAEKYADRLTGARRGVPPPRGRADQRPGRARHPDQRAQQGPPLDQPDGQPQPAHASPTARRPSRSSRCGSTTS